MTVPPKVVEVRQPFASAQVTCETALTLGHLRALVASADTLGMAEETRLQLGELMDTDRAGRTFACVGLLEYYGKPVKR